MAQDYLLKTEPSEYSFADLQRDKVTVWDGVSNPVALKHLRAMEPGERLVIYETGDHKSAVGTASVVSVDAGRSAKSSGEDQGRQSSGAAGFAGGDQGQQAVRRLATGASRKALRRAVNGSTVQSSDGRVAIISVRQQLGRSWPQCRRDCAVSPPTKGRAKTNP